MFDFTFSGGLTTYDMLAGSLCCLHSQSVRSRSVQIASVTCRRTGACLQVYTRCSCSCWHADVLFLDLMSRTSSRYGCRSPAVFYTIAYSVYGLG